MIRNVIVLFTIIIAICNVLLIAMAPDSLSMGIAGLMLLVIIGGAFIGILPMSSIYNGLHNGIKTIKDTTIGSSAWETVSSMGSVFRNKKLDEIFDSYKDKIRAQESSGQIISEIKEYINEDIIASRCWNSLVSQIPGTLTSLGILGTFLGLIMGISKLGFTSADAALESVENLLGGIRLAFYTSIVGIIMAILFNILHRAVWTIMTRELYTFTDLFHKNVIPSREEQEKYREQIYRDEVLERLERLPKASKASDRETVSMNEKILMPQIVEGLKNGDFDFVLEKKHDVHTKRVIAAEVIPRWNHKKLGNIPYSTFMPIVEESGIIVKLNRQIWERAFSTMHDLMESGVKFVPFALNVSKTDLLADKSDISGYFKVMMQKFGILPRMLEVEIAEDAFTDAPDVAFESAKNLRDMGIKVIMDNFDGNFIPIDALDIAVVDEVKLDITDMDTKESCEVIKDTFDQAKVRNMDVSVCGVRAMQQLNTIRKKSGTLAQGKYLSEMVEPEKISEAEG